MPSIKTYRQSTIVPLPAISFQFTSPDGIPMTRMLPCQLLLTLLMLAATTAVAQEPASSAQKAPSKLSAQDRLRIEIQQICPVSGKPLGSMGDPIKVRLGEQSAFVCCQGCTSGPVAPEHWARVQNNLAEAQGTCPIMDKPVDGTMKFTVVEGQPIFVCCPPCIEKIQADPKVALAHVQSHYAQTVKERQDTHDRWQIAAQKICPVSGDPRGSQGEPVKVRLGEQESAFLCSRDCLGKPLDPKLWAKVQANLAAAQSVCPVMGKPVTADMKYTVIKGRRIYVFCPPCIEKIEAAPESFLAKVDQQIAKSTSAGASN